MPHHHKLKRRDDGSVNLTPMIDVVFQLIIFFIVTIQLEKEENEDIILEKAPAAAVIDDMPKTALEIEVDRRGWVSIHGAEVSDRALLGIVKRRYRQYGEFPIVIRGDKDAKHVAIRRVMDICTQAGLWQISFSAIKEEKVKKKPR